MMPISMYSAATHTQDKQDDTGQRAQPYNTYTG